MNTAPKTLLIPTISRETETHRSVRGETMIVDGFLDTCIHAANLETSEDAPRWAKWIDSVDTSLKTGFCFVGEFINDGTVEIPLGKSKLILAQVSITDEKMKSGFLRQFRVLKMDPAPGNYVVYPTHIKTDDRRGGWALRIRDITANLLRDIQSPAKPEGNRFSNVEVE